MLRILSDEFFSFFFKYPTGPLDLRCLIRNNSYVYFFFQVQFYTAQNVRICYSSEEAQLKDELFSNKGRCDLVSCFLSFPSRGLSRVFCIASVACLIKLFCSSAFTSSVSLLCSVCSAHFWNHLQSQGGKEAKIHFGATWKRALIRQIEPSDGTNSKDKKYILLMRFPPCQLTQSIPLMSCSSLLW